MSEAFTTGKPRGDGRRVDARWSLRRTFPTGRGPYNLDVTPDGRILVGTLKQGGAVEFIDLASGESLVGQQAGGIAFWRIEDTP